MKFSKLILYIGLTIIGFWLLGLVFKLAVWSVHIALIIGAVLVVLSLVYQYYEEQKTKNKRR